MNMKEGEKVNVLVWKSFQHSSHIFPAFLLCAPCARRIKLAYTAVWKLHGKYFSLLFTLFSLRFSLSSGARKKSFDVKLSSLITHYLLSVWLDFFIHFFLLVTGISFRYHSLGEGIVYRWKERDMDDVSLRQHSYDTDLANWEWATLLRQYHKCWSWCKLSSVCRRTLHHRRYLFDEKSIVSILTFSFLQRRLQSNSILFLSILDFFKARLRNLQKPSRSNKNNSSNIVTKSSKKSLSKRSAIFPSFQILLHNKTLLLRFFAHHNTNFSSSKPKEAYF